MRLVRNQFSPDAHSLFSDVEVPLPAKRKAGFVECRKAPVSIALHAPVCPDDMTEQRTGQLAWEVEFFSYRSVELLAQLTGCVDFFAKIDYFRQPVRSILV